MSKSKAYLWLPAIIAAVTVVGLAPAHAAKPSPKLTKAKLECRLVFGPGATGKVRFESVSAYERRFMTTVEVDAAEDTGAEGDVALYQDGDVLPVSIGSIPPFGAGAITLAQEDDGLEGALKFDYRAGKGRSVNTFPESFPTLAAGTAVTVDGRTCTLQDRSRRGGSRKVR